MQYPVLAEYAGTTRRSVGRPDLPPTEEAAGMSRGRNVTRQRRGERVGDEHVAVVLERGLGDLGIVLHDLRVPGSRSTIDHVVLAPSGVWVVDSKWRCELKPELDTLEGATSVDEVGRHVDGVANAVGGRATELPIRAALCFPSENWGGDLRAFWIDGVLVTYPEDLVERIRADGPLDDETIGCIAARLALDPEP
jgi:Nuclease-related domain